jgi:outer membrane protein assembly factor BamB
MKASSVRHLSASWSGPIFAAATFKSSVSIWNFETRAMVASFPTILDYGGTRLAIDETGARCVAGAYQRHGVSCYSVTDGRPIWHRSGMGRVQTITMLLLQSAIACGFNHRSLEILSLSDGRTLGRLRGCRSLLISPFGPVQLADKAQPELQTLDGSLIAKIRRQTFAILAAVFGPSSLVISEAGGPVSSFDLTSGTLVWRYHPPEGSHSVKLGFNRLTGNFMGVEWQFRSGGRHTLIILDSSSGEILSRILLLDSVVHQFLLEGTRLLGSSGWVLNTSTGHIEAPFTFPERDGYKE